MNVRQKRVLRWTIYGALLFVTMLDRKSVV